MAQLGERPGQREGKPFNGGSLQRKVLLPTISWYRRYVWNKTSCYLLLPLLKLLFLHGLKRPKGVFYLLALFW